jgi:AraC-like DNA-binding protein
MLLAADRLLQGDPVSSIAPDLGYSSESAFSTAFKRVMRCSPRMFGAGAQPARRSARHDIAETWPEERAVLPDRSGVPQHASGL